MAIDSMRQWNAQFLDPIYLYISKVTFDVSRTITSSPLFDLRYYTK